MKEITIQAKKTWSLSDLAEIWQYRELLYIFAWRDIKVRYKQTVLGILWVVFQPLITTVIFTVFFGNLARISSGEFPYAFFVLIGLVYWSFFSGIVSRASDTIIANEQIIKKVYFPKIILPLSCVITGFIDFCINLVILFAFAIFMGVKVSIFSLLLLPILIVATAIAGLGLGLGFSSLNVRFRDVRYILPFFIQLLMYLSPVIYPLTIVSDRNRLFLALNPLTSVIELSRYSFSGQYSIHGDIIGISFISSFILLCFGVWYFKRTEQFIADIV